MQPCLVFAHFLFVMLNEVVSWSSVIEGYRFNVSYLTSCNKNISCLLLHPYNQAGLYVFLKAAKNKHDYTNRLKLWDLVKLAKIRTRLPSTFSPRWNRTKCKHTWFCSLYHFGFNAKHKTYKWTKTLNLYHDWQALGAALALPLMLDWGQTGLNSDSRYKWYYKTGIAASHAFFVNISEKQCIEILDMIWKQFIHIRTTACIGTDS